MNNTGNTLYCVGMAQNKKYCYLEVAETDSVVVEIPKLFFAGEQVRDELVNVNKMQTNLEGSVVKAPSLGPDYMSRAGLSLPGSRYVC